MIAHHLQLRQLINWQTFRYVLLKWDWPFCYSRETGTLAIMTFAVMTQVGLEHICYTRGAGTLAIMYYL